MRNYTTLRCYCRKTCLHMYPISIFGLIFDADEKVNSEDESMEEGSRMDKFSPAATSTNLRPKHAEALKSLHDEKNDDERMKDDE